MSVVPNPTDRPSEDVTATSNINPDEIVADELYSLLDAVDSESIADEFRIGVHSEKHDFTNHVKVTVREGLVHGCSASLPYHAPDAETGVRTECYTLR